MPAGEEMTKQNGGMIGYDEFFSTCKRHGIFLFFFSSRRRHTRLQGDWSSDVCSSDLVTPAPDSLATSSKWYVSPRMMQPSATRASYRSDSAIACSATGTSRAPGTVTWSDRKSVV